MVGKIGYAVSVCLLFAVTYGEITNVQQCVNVPLSRNVLADFAFRDNSTVPRAFLGFLRGCIEGDFVSFLTPMSDALRMEEGGCTNLSQLSSNEVERFSRFAQEAGFTNHSISAYNEFATNGNTRVNAKVVSVRGPMVKTNDVNMVFCHTNSEWRILFWDVDE